MTTEMLLNEFDKITQLLKKERPLYLLNHRCTGFEKGFCKMVESTCFFQMIENLKNEPPKEHHNSRNP